MKSAAIMLGIVAVLAIIGFIASRFLRSRNDGFGGFRDWVRNPGYKQAAADHFVARDALKVPADTADDEIQRMVDRLFVQTDGDFNLDRLKLVGDKAVPMLIKALEDPRTASTQFGNGGFTLNAQSPFERIVELLEPIAPDDAVQPLAKYIDHEDDHFRKHAALALGNIGNPECIVPMLKALDDDNDYVRSYAVKGIQRGMQAQRCTTGFLHEVFPALTKLLNRPDGSVRGAAPELLLAIDTGRATPVLLSPENFSVDNKQVHYIIRALNAAGSKIPHDTLLPFLKAVQPLANKYPHTYHYAEALRAYAHNPDASAEQVFRAALKSKHEKVQEAAAEALAVLSGVSNARKFVLDSLDNHGFDHLTPPQQHYYAVFIYDAEVNNGGHSQYFVNSSGDHWRSALKGLEAIGANARAKILQEATALFGADGPPVDNAPRHQRLATFTAPQEKSLDELDSQYNSCDENIDVLLAQYALHNKEHFTATK